VGFLGYTQNSQDPSANRLDSSRNNIVTWKRNSQHPEFLVWTGTALDQKRNIALWAMSRETNIGSTVKITYFSHIPAQDILIPQPRLQRTPYWSTNSNFNFPKAMDSYLRLHFRSDPYGKYETPFGRMSIRFEDLADQRTMFGNPRNLPRIDEDILFDTENHAQDPLSSSIEKEESFTNDVRTFLEKIKETKEWILSLVFAGSVGLLFTLVVVLVKDMESLFKEIKGSKYEKWTRVWLRKIIWGSLLTGLFIGLAHFLLYVLSDLTLYHAYTLLEKYKPITAGIIGATTGTVVVVDGLLILGFSILVFKNRNKRTTRMFKEAITLDPFPEGTQFQKEQALLDAWIKNNPLIFGSVLSKASLKHLAFRKDNDFEELKVILECDDQLIFVAFECKEHQITTIAYGVELKDKEHDKRIHKSHFGKDILVTVLQWLRDKEKGFRIANTEIIRNHEYPQDSLDDDPQVEVHKHKEGLNKYDHERFFESALDPLSADLNKKPYRYVYHDNPYAAQSHHQLLMIEIDLQKIDFSHYVSVSNGLAVRHHAVRDFYKWLDDLLKWFLKVLFLKER
jgi:hypothetical protein